MSSVITVGELLERAELEVTAVAGQAGVDRIVSVPRIQKPGLALTGWPAQPDRPRAPGALADPAEGRGVRVLVSTLATADFIAAVTGWMSDRLAPSTDMHGVLLDVLGIGVLRLGRSGIGKSETALDLVVRGHRLVADDVIRLRRQGSHVVGRGSGIIGHHMEVRGVGNINIKRSEERRGGRE